LDKTAAKTEFDLVLTGCSWDEKQQNNIYVMVKSI
jgi:hypothetical protein